MRFAAKMFCIPTDSTTHHATHLSGLRRSDAPDKRDRRNGNRARRQNTELSRYGWIAFLIANFAVIGFAHGIRAHGLFVQQLGFMGTSILGLVRAFWPHL
jgi:hypothetical protein